MLGKKGIPFNSSTRKGKDLKKYSKGHIEKNGELKEKIFLFEDRLLRIAHCSERTACLHTDLTPLY